MPLLTRVARIVLTCFAAEEYNPAEDIFVTYDELLDDDDNVSPW